MSRVDVGKVCRIAAVALALQACGGPLRYEVHGTPLAPGVDAKITARLDKKTTVTRLDLEAKNLAPPERLVPGASQFVVWARLDRDTWRRVGALDYDGDDRRGRLKGTSVGGLRFDLLITIEASQAPSAPSPNVLFSKRINAG